MAATFVTKLVSCISELIKQKWYNYHTLSISFKKKVNIPLIIR